MDFFPVFAFEINLKQWNRHKSVLLLNKLCFSQKQTHYKICMYFVWGEIKGVYLFPKTTKQQTCKQKEIIFFFYSGR